MFRSARGVNRVLITRGEQGMWLSAPDIEHLDPVDRARGSDVTGAGDTVVATLALALAAGATLFEAALLANHAAGVVVVEVRAVTSPTNCSHVRLRLRSFTDHGIARQLRRAARLRTELQPARSVAEMPPPGEHHRDAVLVGGRDDFRVAHRSAGLDDGGRARLRDRIETVAERKERV